VPYLRDQIRNAAVQAIADRKTLPQILAALPKEAGKTITRETLIATIAALVVRMNRRGITIHATTAKEFPAPGPEAAPYAPKGLDLDALKKPRKTRSDKGTKRGKQARHTPTPARKAPKAAETQPTKRQEKSAPKLSEPIARVTKPKTQKPKPSPALEEIIPDAD
jgi:hypothetical protein